MIVMPLELDPLPQQAADLAVLYALNFVTGADVVTWAERLTPEELLATAAAGFEQAEAHFFIGLNLLSEGKREQAREHFEKAAGRRSIYTFDQIWSQAFLTRAAESEMATLDRISNAAQQRGREQGVKGFQP